MTDVKQPIAPHHVLWLLLALVMVVAPHASHLPWWTIALVVALIAWRAYLGYTRLAMPSRWLLFLVAVASAIGIFLSYRALFGREAGVALLLAMVGLKLLETRTLRDATLLIFLAYFLVLTNFLYSQTIVTGFYMLACTLVITATMIGLNYARTEPRFPVQLRAAGVMLAQSVPLMLVLFLLFPRVPGPLWGLPRDAFAGVSGLSDTMSPGSVTSLTLSDAVAFRVRFESPKPRLRDLYWRGPLMWDFDGRTWSASYFFYALPRIEAAGDPVSYEITLEPHNRRWMFALDLPAMVPPRAAVSTDYQLHSVVPVNNRMRYDMTSYLNARYGQGENRHALNRALQLPPGSNPRALEMGRELRRKHAGDGAIVDEVLRMFRTENFFYTLEPLAVVLLTFFFMTFGENLQRNAIALLPTRQRKKLTVDILQSIELEISRYVLTITIINSLLGLAVAGSLYALGLATQEALLWGTVAALLNFAPYVGPLIGVGLMLLMGFVTFEGLWPDYEWSPLAPAAIYLALHTVEGQIVTPIVLGRRMAPTASSFPVCVTGL